MSDQDPARDDLPLPDYDHLPVTGLGHRIRSLSISQIETLLAYEHAHGNRLPVVQVLETRLQELADGAEPSGGDATDVAPEHSADPSAGGPVSPATASDAPTAPPDGVAYDPAQAKR